jgi:hypothetical protein
MRIQRVIVLALSCAILGLVPTAVASGSESVRHVEVTGPSMDGLVTFSVLGVPIHEFPAHVSFTSRLQADATCSGTTLTWGSLSISGDVSGSGEGHGSDVTGAWAFAVFPFVGPGSSDGPAVTNGVVTGPGSVSASGDLIVNGTLVQVSFSATGEVTVSSTFEAIPCDVPTLSCPSPEVGIAPICTSNPCPTVAECLAPVGPLVQSVRDCLAQIVPDLGPTSTQAPTLEDCTFVGGAVETVVGLVQQVLDTACDGRPVTDCLT